jgi:hypothetical protein
MPFVALNRLRPFLLVLVLATLAPAAPASALLVDAAGGGVRVVAAPGEANDLHVALAGGAFTITDANGAVAVAAGSAARRSAAGAPSPAGRPGSRA